MLIDSKKLKGFTIHATDGDLGTLDQIYFDDESWAVRYLTVETGGWLGGRSVLISPHSVTHLDQENGTLNVALTMAQVENSPPIDTHKPVSRQHETEYLGYYGFPLYWQGSGMLISESYPSPSGIVPTQAAVLPADPKNPEDQHLRSIEEIGGYYIEAVDGEIGHVDKFIVDDANWSIRYLEIATQNWWPGKKVLVSPSWVEKVSWSRSKVHVALTRQAIQDAPEYEDGTDITRDYENRLFSHYGRPTYWPPEL